MSMGWFNVRRVWRIPNWRNVDAGLTEVRLMPRHTRGVLQQSTGFLPPNLCTSAHRQGARSLNDNHACDPIGRYNRFSCGRSETLSRALVLVVLCVHSLAGDVTGTSNCRGATKAGSYASAQLQYPSRWQPGLKILMSLMRSLMPWLSYSVRDGRLCRRMARIKLPL